MIIVYTEQQTYLIAAKVLSQQAIDALEIALSGLHGIAQEARMAIHKQELLIAHREMSELKKQLQGDSNC